MEKSADKSRVVGGNRKRVLLLGAGHVTGPIIDYFSKEKDIEVTVATEHEQDGQRLAAKSDNVSSRVLDVHKDLDALETMIGEHDICMSLLPYELHPLVAQLCIKRKTNMVTSSYISPELQALDQAAQEAGITVMNESGLDPGIDHMLAMECIDRVKEHGGKVLSFESFCGGLPAPECSNNPLRYKFSWSPKAALQALLNPARFMKDGEVIELPTNGGMLDFEFPIDFMPSFNLVGFANRNSMLYADVYGIAGDCKTVLRGTLRYKGFSSAIKAMKKVGLLSEEHNPLFDSTIGPDLTWKQLMAGLMNQPIDIYPDILRNIVAERLGKDMKIEFEALDQLDFFSDALVERYGTPLDTLAGHLAKELAFKPKERDLVILNHDIKIQLPGGALERHQINLTAYGEPEGFSAMARTVGYTSAIVAKIILDGEIQKTGMLRPLTKEVYQPALARLRDLGIEPITTITPLS